MNLYNRNKSCYELEFDECVKNIRVSDENKQEMVEFGNKIMSYDFVEHELPLIKRLSDIYFDKYNIKFKTMSGILDFSITLSIVDEHLTMDEIKEIHFKKQYQDGCYVFE